MQNTKNTDKPVSNPLAPTKWSDPTGLKRIIEQGKLPGSKKEK